MKLVFLGASSLTVATVRMLIRRGHNIVIVERDKAAIERLEEELDCGFVLGDGTRPEILREVGPRESDVLFCLTDNDQNNILASLVGRSLGFARVVTQITDAAYEPICIELGLTDTIIPDRAIARTLSDMTEGQESTDLLSPVKGDARFFSFIVQEEQALNRVSDLTLPSHTRLICIYRGEDYLLPDSETPLLAKDHVVMITHRKHVHALHEKWGEAKPMAK